jgi:hypothetical protein
LAVRSADDNFCFQSILQGKHSREREMPKPNLSMINDKPKPGSRLMLKIADTKEELEGCFAVLHDTYVESGFMKPDPSGMRLSIHYALPTTTTLCAIYDGKVAGTVSLIRESALGMPLQEAFDLTELRVKGGCIVEISALAVSRTFRKNSGIILLPLMKFLYDYCITRVNTRHLVIAVNPRHIRRYESLLLFRRLTESVVESYDFANGAPAIGATLDLLELPTELPVRSYSQCLRNKLHACLTRIERPCHQVSERHYSSPDHRRMSPELLDYFFNIRTRTFANLNEPEKALLHSIYDRPEYKVVLPSLPAQPTKSSLTSPPAMLIKRAMSCNVMLAGC